MISGRPGGMTQRRAGHASLLLYRPAASAEAAEVAASAAAEEDASAPAEAAVASGAVLAAAQEAAADPDAAPVHIWTVRCVVSARPVAGVEQMKDDLMQDDLRVYTEVRASLCENTGSPYATAAQEPRANEARSEFLQTVNMVQVGQPR